MPSTFHHRAGQRPLAPVASPNPRRSIPFTRRASPVRTSKVKLDPPPLPQHRGDDHVDMELDSDDSDFLWEEEETLLLDLMDKPKQKPQEERINDLLNSLPPHFASLGNELKREMAKTFVPTVNFIKDAFRQLDEHMDNACADGIRAFNEASKDMEDILEHELKDFQQGHQRTMTMMESLFQELEDAYAARDKLWVDFETEIKTLVEPAQERLKNHPVVIERCIARLNSQAKSLEKDDDVKTLLAQLFAPRG